MSEKNELRILLNGIALSVHEMYRTNDESKQEAYIIRASQMEAEVLEKFDTLLTRTKTAERENGQLREALEKYANEYNWNTKENNEDVWNVRGESGWDAAQAALDTVKGGDE